MVETTVIVPCFNSQSTIEETLISIRNQTYKKWECLIIDDYSSDNSTNIIKQICSQNNKFKLIRLKKNVGVSEVRNIGIKKSSGKFICFLDSDDLWERDFLEKSTDVLKKSNCKLTYSAYKRFFDSNKNIYFKKFPPRYITLRRILTNNHIPILTAVLNKELISDIKFVNDRFEDYIFWLQIFHKNPDLIAIRSCKKCLANYRISKTQRSSNKLINILRAYRSYRKYLKNSLLLSIFRTFIYVFVSLIDYIKQYLNFTC